MTDNHKPRVASARSLPQLVDAKLLSDEQARALTQVAEKFSIAITPNMLALMDPGESQDPIARQFLPAVEELVTTPEERADPIADEVFTPVRGITHRYPDRVLLKPVHVCAVYCRFCFRRESVGPGSETLGKAELARAMDYIREHAEIWEVILSGGDPLVLPAEKIAEMMDALGAIDHVRVVRFHTRVPSVDPGRITPEMVRALRGGKTTYVVLHVNHASELTSAAVDACAAMIDAGIPMLSQTVLLRGVNDDPAVLETLLRELVVNRIKPYYLHHADLARGTSHFRTTIAEGQDIVRNLRGRVSGLCQPTYVLDIPGGHGKVPIGPSYVSATESGAHDVTDIHGTNHRY